MFLRAGAAGVPLAEVDILRPLRCAHLNLFGDQPLFGRVCLPRGDGHHFLKLTDKDAVFLVVGDRTAGEEVPIPISIWS
jgi:hypothetical protein